MLARVYRDPWDSMRDFRGELDRFFNHSKSVYSDEYSSWTPAVDIKEEDDAYMLVADVPGVNPKEIDISLEEGVLTVKGERSSEKKEDEQGYTRTERIYGSFTRRFTLPDTADAENISAKTEHGVLTLRIPKKAKPEPKRITVEG